METKWFSWRMWNWSKLNADFGIVNLKLKIFLISSVNKIEDKTVPKTFVQSKWREILAHNSRMTCVKYIKASTSTQWYPRYNENMEHKYISQKWIVLSAHSDWLTLRWWKATTVQFWVNEGKQNGHPFRFGYRGANSIEKVGYYSTCVVYTETFIHLSVGESGGYLSSREAAM